MKKNQTSEKTKDEKVSELSDTTPKLRSSLAVSTKSTSNSHGSAKLSNRTLSTRSSTKSAQSRLAILEARIKSNAEIEELEIQAELHWNEEEELLGHRCLQENEKNVIIGWKRKKENVSFN